MVVDKNTRNILEDTVAATECKIVAVIGNSTESQDEEVISLNNVMCSHTRVLLGSKMLKREI